MDAEFYEDSWPDDFANFVTRDVYAAVRRATNELLTMSEHVPYGKAMESIIAILSGKILTHLKPINDLEISCSLCKPEDDKYLMRRLIEADDVGGEYIARKCRISRYLYCLNCKNPTKAMYDMLEAGNQELERLAALSPRIVSHVIALFESFGMAHAAATARRMELFHSSMIGSKLFERRVEMKDSLGRSTLHQWLDNKERYHPNDLKILRKNAPRFDIDAQDILGRTALHIACQKSQIDIVKTLLNLGADPCMITKFSHSPLHYAAVADINITSELCQMLCDRMSHQAITESDKLHCNAYEYVCHRQFEIPPQLGDFWDSHFLIENAQIWGFVDEE